MKLLLDTAVFLWMFFGQESLLSPKAIRLLEDEDNGLLLSTVSSWEITIKYSLGKLDVHLAPKKWLPDAVLKMGLSSLPILSSHTLEVSELPHHHKDPFDRLLVAQARIEKLTLLSPDKILKKYQVPVIW